VAPDLQQRYKQGLLAGERRGEHFIAWVEDRLGPIEAPLLDVGCGTSGLLLAAHRRHIQAWGVDIALRWLVIGRQRLREAGCEPLLLCANAEALPFSNGAFRAALSDSTLEHVTDSARALSETIRICEPGAVFAVRTVNERSLVESYTGFPLPGLFPRRIRNQVIAKICRTPYLLQPPSSSLLKEFLKTHPFLHFCAYLPLFDYQAKRNRLLSLFLKIYQRMSDSRLGNVLLRRVGLFLCMYGRLPRTGAS
jgi:ubiquinone/menaquinone biosynthesis C-methylase UbiE